MSREKELHREPLEEGSNSGLFDREALEAKHEARSKGVAGLPAVQLNERYIFGAVNPDDHTNHIGPRERAGRWARTTHKTRFSQARRTPAEYAELSAGARSPEERERLSVSRRAALETLSELDAVNQRPDGRTRSKMNPERRALDDVIYELIRFQRQELAHLGYPPASAFTRPRVDHAHSAAGKSDAGLEMPPVLQAAREALQWLRPELREVVRARYENWHSYEVAARKCGYKNIRKYRVDLDFACRLLIELLWEHIQARVQARQAA